MKEDDRIRVTRGPHEGWVGTIRSASNLPGMSWVCFDSALTDEQWCIAHDDMALLPTTPALEQLVAAAKEAGAECIWLLRGATAAALVYTDDGVTLPAIKIAPPHELVVVMRFPVGDGGEAGVEFRT